MRNLKGTAGVAVFTFFIAGCTAGAPPLSADCSLRMPRSVVVGTGADSFVPIAQDPLVIHFGPQGGAHLYLSLRTRELGPDVMVNFGVVDADAGTVYSGPRMSQTVLEYNDDSGSYEAVGILSYLETCVVHPMPHCANPSGHKVDMWAEVTDFCGVTTRGEAHGTVR